MQEIVAIAHGCDMILAFKVFQLGPWCKRLIPRLFVLTQSEWQTKWSTKSSLKFSSNFLHDNTINLIELAIDGSVFQATRIRCDGVYHTATKTP